ncbi:MAG: hypothetical protein EOS10_15490 [Mesorhizobium sp.]|uniref:hypothetical protein n=1 Tax=Mesorhizobium sp. TaxID=1871066 RepID=UPI000FE5D364|nr:hypothetical protein [Mesorhizobium sp.]RWO31119.1 MAG: hypothetical protein EOS10_15490 [Mesorhizobium sp.]
MILKTIRGKTIVGKTIVGAGLAVALLAAVASTALADDTPELTEISPDGKDACFGRIYDAAHLKVHPNQKVGRIFFYHGSDPVSPPTEEPSSGPSGYNGFLATTVRGANKPEWVGGWCGKDDPQSGEIHCGMECDRTMALVNVDEKGRLIVSGVHRNLYLDAGAEDELGETEFSRQALGTEDDGFRLDRMPAQTCKAEFARIDPVDPALGAPLRERLKPDQPFCYGRDYDAAHLGSHPDQLTHTIRVFRGPIELAAFAKNGDTANWPDGADIAISVTTRQNAVEVTQSYSCDGEADQWRCVASGRTSDFSCDIAAREIFLRRGANGTMMLANPNSSLPIVDLCSKATVGETASDDKVYRLEPMPQAACAP